MFSSPLELRAKLTSYIDEKVFPPLTDEGLFRIRVQVLNLQVPRGSPATASSVDAHLALAGKSIPSYLVVDRRVRVTKLAVLRRGVATLRGRSRHFRLFGDVPGLLSVTSVLVHSLLDVAMALLEPISGRNLVPTTIRAIALRPWKLMCCLISWQRPAIAGRMAKVRLRETPAGTCAESRPLPVHPAFTCVP